VGQRLRGENVLDTLNRLVAKRGKSEFISLDNGAEFTGQLMDMWAYHHGVHLDFLRPGKPTDNAFIESFDGTLRDKCLNLNWFETLEDAQATIEAWLIEYNDSQSHMPHNGVSPTRPKATRSGLLLYKQEI
jgi:putative transposase